MKPEHFPFRQGDLVTILTFDGPTCEGHMLGASEGGITIKTGVPMVRFIPWTNFAGASSGSLTRERIGEIGAAVSVPGPMHPALADAPAPYSDQWLAGRQEI